MSSLGDRKKRQSEREREEKKRKSYKFITPPLSLLFILRFLSNSSQQCRERAHVCVSVCVCVCVCMRSKAVTVILLLVYGNFLSLSLLCVAFYSLTHAHFFVIALIQS